MLSGVRHCKEEFYRLTCLLCTLNNDLIADVRNSSYGIHVGSLFVGCLF